MTLRHSETPAPSLDEFLSWTLDSQRKIKTRCWNLADVQLGLKSGAVKMTLTTKAQTEIATELRWSQSELLGFFHSLTLARYWDSEWCLPSGHCGRYAPMRADSYVMGYNRFTGIENQMTVPWVYAKFTVRDELPVPTVLIFSMHPERDRI